MNKVLRNIAFVAILFVTPVAFAGKGITLEEAVERMFAGKLENATLRN